MKRFLCEELSLIYNDNLELTGAVIPKKLNNKKLNKEEAKKYFESSKKDIINLIGDKSIRKKDISFASLRKDLVYPTTKPKEFKFAIHSNPQSDYLELKGQPVWHIAIKLEGK